jgi:hypothetical protein
MEDHYVHPKSKSNHVSVGNYDVNLCLLAIPQIISSLARLYV